ncbi:MAG: NifB/NifX family molybdenum-iron cluster-binding protein [Spirochaetes bacterium]|jgi:predicted Fe-Mo cluster-binding NifX family protein|nr:NifB/NifX family molybdenum-iron cluster-binding protein [Spirochaetota bacterium]
MKIAITSDGRDLSSSVDDRFGRAKGFIIYDLDSEEFDFIENSQGLDSIQGAGIQAVKTVINSGIKSLITGNVGTKAYSALAAADIDVFTGVKGTVKDAIGKYQSGILKKTSGDNLEGHGQS